MDKVGKIRAEIQRRFVEAGLHDGVIAEIREDELGSLLSFIDSLEEEPDCVYNHTPNNPQITIGTKIRLKANPNVVLSIISDDCHEDEFECSNGSVLSLKQIEKYYDLII